MVGEGGNVKERDIEKGREKDRWTNRQRDLLSHLTVPIPHLPSFFLSICPCLKVYIILSFMISLFPSLKQISLTDPLIRPGH